MPLRTVDLAGRVATAFRALCQDDSRIAARYGRDGRELVNGLHLALGTHSVGTEADADGAITAASREAWRSGGTRPLHVGVRFTTALVLFAETITRRSRPDRPMPLPLGVSGQRSAKRRPRLEITQARQRQDDEPLHGSTMSDPMMPRPRIPTRWIPRSLLPRRMSCAVSWFRSAAALMEIGSG